MWRIEPRHRPREQEPAARGEAGVRVSSHSAIAPPECRRSHGHRGKELEAGRRSVVGGAGTGWGVCRAGRRAEQAEASACTADESRRTITGEIKHPRPTAIPSVGERVEMHLWEVVWKD